ncbi:hypothetical protein [Engelhardtia mirabilis]
MASKKKLKGGARTGDDRLDRVVQFDEASRGYAIRQRKGQRTRRSYTWRCDKFLDQGEEGACVGFSIGHELSAHPAPVQRIGPSFCRKKIYWEAQRRDPWEGGEYPGARPHYGGTSLLVGVKVARSMGWFEEYRWSFSFSSFLLGLGYHGPAVIGITWHEGMVEPDAQGFVRPTGGEIGGHCILANGVDVRERTVTLHNSWGKSWGTGGECKVRWRDMEDLLADSGEAVFFVDRSTR